MDITNFMTWFLSEVVKIFTFVFSTLDNITFMGTSLLNVILTIVILSALLPILLTIARSSRVSRSGHVKGEKYDKETDD